MSLSKNSRITLATGLAFVSAFALTGTAFAAENTAGFVNHGNPVRPVIIGTVSAVNGTTLMVSSKKPQKDFKDFNKSKTATTTAYTVNASAAKVTKNNATTTLSAIAIGDTVMVEGKVSGTIVTATLIRDGVAKMGKGLENKDNEPKDVQPNMIIQGNGQPVIGGSVTAISGTTITVANKSNITYTIDASNAVIEKKNAASTLSSITVGDNVVVQGAVNGTSIVASSVIDQGTPNIKNNSASTTPKNRGGGFFSTVGGFFSRIFGFF